MTIERFDTVFLDRDGVLNRKLPEGHYVGNVAAFDVLPGVPEAIARLNRAGKLVVVVSNQRGVSLGLYAAADVEAIHATFQRQLAEHGARVDGFFFCPHDRNQCNCRKPLPGMFEQAVERFPQIASGSGLMIGDSVSDIEFGSRLGMRTILIAEQQSGERPSLDQARAVADWVCASLREAVDFLLGSQSR